MKSSDGGASFGISANGIGRLDLPHIHANPLDEDELAVAFEGLNDGGVYSSTDGGATWLLENAPATRYSVVKLAPDGTLYAVSSGPSSIAPEGLYRRESDGTWTSLGPDQGSYFESDLFALRFSLNNPNLIVIAGADFGVAGNEATIWRSTDAGATWVKEYEGSEEAETVTDLEIVEDTTDSVMVACFTDWGSSNNDPGALRSTDAGVTWVKSSSVLPPDVRPSALASWPSDPNTLFLSDELYNDGGLYMTTDAGLTWTSTGYTVAEGVYDVLADPAVGTTLYIAQGGSQKALVSYDKGATFVEFDDGLEDSGSPRALEVAGGEAPRLLMATSNGAYARSLDLLFADDFETGGTGEWSAVVP
jgi:photosystem II stability/assembly factor-like uncharacterized protein